MSDIRNPAPCSTYETDDDAMTVATDVITRFGTVGLCWYGEMVINGRHRTLRSRRDDSGR